MFGPEPATGSAMNSIAKSPTKVVTVTLGDLVVAAFDNTLLASCDPRTRAQLAAKQVYSVLAHARDCRMARGMEVSCHK
jgi:pyridoxal/pyridoxine/pyridoxamine kinase